MTEALGEPCPAFVFANYNDHDYVKVVLDGPSTEFALKNAGQFREPLTRQMIWHTLWESVVDGQLKAQDYADAVLDQIKQETEARIVTRVMSQMMDSKIFGSGGDTGLNRNSALRLMNSPDARAVRRQDRRARDA